MGPVAQAESDGHAIEIVVRERQLFSVGLNELDIAGYALVQQAVTADFEHGRVDISQHDLAGRADQMGKLAGQVTGAAEYQHVTRAIQR